MSLDSPSLGTVRARGAGARQVYSLSWPLLVGSLASMLSGVIDVAVMGHTSTEALAGVSAANAIFAVVLTICQPIGSAHQIAAAKGFGRDDSEAVRASLGVALRSGVFLGVAAAVLLAMAAPFALSLMTSDAVAAGQGTIYLRVRAAELVFFVPFVLLNGTFGAAKMTRPGMWAMIAANAVNVFADILLVLGLGLGGLGSALGNLSGCVVAVAILLVAFRRRADRLRLGSLPAALRRRVPSGELTDFLRLASPLGISGLLDNTGALLVFGLIGHAGAPGAAAARVAYTVMVVAFVVLRSFATGGQILIGRGLHDDDLSGRMFHAALVAVAPVALFGTAVVWILATPISDLLLSAGTTGAGTSDGVRSMALVLPLMAVVLVLAANLRARGRTAGDMYANIAAVWAVQVPAAVLLLSRGVPAVTVLVLAYGGYWAARGGLLLVMRRRPCGGDR
jgi:MATE family multidrug resistance protein